MQYLISASASETQPGGVGFAINCLRIGTLWRPYLTFGKGTESTVTDAHTWNVADWYVVEQVFNAGAAR